MLTTRLLPGTHAYDGSPLGGHWAFRVHGIQGDSLLAFMGPCDVRVEALADLQDARDGAFIYSPRMLHFVLELFGPSLEEAHPPVADGSHRGRRAQRPPGKAGYPAQRE